MGTAAGGGFPQWNCRCPNCQLARTTEGGLHPRLQSSLVLRSGKQPWLLLNASPDLPRQIELYLNCLIEPEQQVRSSPVAEVYLTNADLDHAMGLLLLREGKQLRVKASDGVRETLGRHLRFDDILASGCGINWESFSDGWQATALQDIVFRAIPLVAAKPPRFSPDTLGCHGVGYVFRDQTTGHVMGFFPDVAEMDAALLGVLELCDLVFFDGTFWSDKELEILGISERTSRQMGHVPVVDSLTVLGELTAKGTRVYYLHINNTNPILNPQSSERRQLDAAGVRLAEDGMRLLL